MSPSRRNSNSPNRRFRSKSRESLARNRSNSREKIFQNNRKVSFDKSDNLTGFSSPKVYKKEIYPIQKSKSEENIFSKIEDLTKSFKDFSNDQSKKINNIESEIIHLKNRETMHTQLGNFSDPKYAPFSQSHRRQNSVRNLKHFVPTITFPEGVEKNVDISLRPQRAENQLWREMSVADKLGFKKPRCNFCNSDIRHDFKLCKKIQLQKNVKVPRKGLI